MNIFLEIALKSAGLLAFAAVTAWLFRAGTATLRHRIWALTFVGLAVLPLLAFRLPAIRIERPASSVTHISTAAKPTKAAPSRTIASNQPTPSPDFVTKSATWNLDLLVWAWGLGVALLLGRTLVHLLLASRLAARGEDIAVDPGLGLPAHTRVVRARAVSVPVTLGFLRPTILMPSSSLTWPAERVQAVLMHEGAHIRRGDWAWLIFGRVIGALYWPNLLVVWAASRMRVESELAADEAVLSQGVDARDYAATLVDLAEGLRGRSMGAALPFVEAGSLKERVAAILTSPGRLRPLGRSAAIIALLFTAAVVIPYAAVKLEAGPELIRDGYIDLGDGHHAEIVAITEMNGSTARSWDIHGAVLRRSFPVTADNQKTFEFMHQAPAGVTIRYVVFRLDDGNADFPMLQSTAGEDLICLPYTDPSITGEFSFEDALGGSYRVVRITTPHGARDAGIRMRLPTADWKLYAYTNFKNGQVTGLLNPTAGINIAPMMPGQGHGTEATFVLSQDLAGQESRLRFLPDAGGRANFEGMTGPQIALTNDRPESVTRVEILTRPQISVELANLPIQPISGSVYSPRHFLPQHMVEAKHGLVRLSDGTELNIFDTSSLSSQAEIASNPPSPNHKVRLTIRRIPGGSGGLQTLYDDEGWPLAEGAYTGYSSQDAFVNYSASVDRKAQYLNAATRIPVGQFRLIQTFKRDRSQGTSWRFVDKKDSAASLRLEYPMDISSKMKDMDCEIHPLDAKGKLVTGPNGDQGYSYSYSEGWMELNLPRSAADRVATVEVLTRPYTWVHFTNFPIGLAALSEK